ncbi:hypothetical protein [Lutibacter flavus]|uniref:Uncharacterized protein n=1 Tax=Lutibacter flavus TaxID=691689 RepID=A0A238X1H3_9FLAO|nr:hypothetical protein [Lutibacter flavus]SNR52825.1 hypothetical protein SAMN04488111_1481 [Lutibacter flavus]
MKLTPNQIQELYKFTRQHYVEHYDVQTELVDHLANDIEQIWQEQPKLSFEQARTISFKKFGVFGFMEVVEARTKALSKKYWKLVWGIFKQFFNIPHILITITIFLALYVSFQIFPAKWLIVSIGIGSMLVIGTRLFLLNKEKKTRFKESNKKWLFEEYVFNLGGSIGFINLFIQTANLSPLTISNIAIVVTSIILTSLFLLIYIITFILPSKIEEILENQYPEYKMV